MPKNKTLCLYKLGRHCRHKDRFNKKCGSLREIFCSRKHHLEDYLKKKRYIIEEDYPHQRR
jgi:hypothetical protein